MENSEILYQVREVNIHSILRRLVSNKFTIVLFLLVGITIGFICFFLYQPSYDISVAYSFNISPNDSLSTMYYVNYTVPEQLVSLMMHENTVSSFIQNSDLDESGLKVQSFLKPFSISYDNKVLTINILGVKNSIIDIYKSYIYQCIDSYNQECRTVLGPQLSEANTELIKEIEEENSKQAELENNSNFDYSYIAKLTEMKKNVEIQRRELEEGAFRLYTDYNQIMASSRGRSIVLIVLVFLFIGAVVDFFISIFDKRIYYSDDICSEPGLSKRLFSCIPLHIKSVISQKDLINLMSKVPEDINSISLTEISKNAGASEIVRGLNESFQQCDVKYSGCLKEDADILTSFPKFDLNLIVVRAGIDTINQLNNINHDCEIKEVNNYYFILVGLESSDKMVTLFEDQSNYFKYPICSIKTLKRYYHDFVRS